MVYRDTGEKMDMNKKGMFFTIIVLVLLSLFLVTYTFYSDVKNRDPIQKRITTMDNFLFSIEKDLPRQLYISGFRTIFLVEKQILETGRYNSNIDSTFQEAFFEGEINDIPQEIMIGATFNDISNNIQEKAKKLNINITMTNPNLTITQTDPWNVKVSLRTSLFMEDNNDLATWNKTQVFEAFIPIEDFEDPFYTINTQGLVINKIRESPFEVFVDGSNVSNLLNHSLESYYIESDTAPGFLDRLQGVTAANQNGIESLVNLQKLSSQGINVKSKSAVDYIYFSESSPQSCNIQGMPSWFRLDTDHLTIYQANGLESNCN